MEKKSTVLGIPISRSRQIWAREGIKPLLPQVRVLRHVARGVLNFLRVKGRQVESYMSPAMGVAQI